MQGGALICANDRLAFAGTVAPSRVDLGGLIGLGVNEITIVLTTTLKNRLASMKGRPGYLHFLYEPLTQPYGLLGPIRLVPYGQRLVS